MQPQSSSPPALLDRPEPRTTLALRREDAAKALGVSDETFDRHVRPSLPVVRLGSVRVYPVAALEAWLLDHADTPMAELERVA
jgi:hypothetical protein